ncbi:hypothetical protein THRCLA_21258 [Thraustotheca clavata]|uniref:Uncharacterized protein n=1 Tax=Thraustotheca clavata TaxID=74557 RepID=A0A1V9ZYK0_9STRA|nr:hypothetical protein THRCLA_21258 [Thraustotheca clavata]
MIALNVSQISFRIWALWVKFDAITDIGLFHPDDSKSSTKVNLSIAANLGVWVQLRNSVISATKLYGIFIQVLISLSIVQLAISFGGLLLYCLTGNAPMPTYFLLMLGLASSLLNLMFLLPLAAALSIQSKQSDMLREVLHRYYLEKSRGEHDPEESHVENYLHVIIDTIDNHDDRLRFWGVEMSTSALKGLSVTLASGISFILSKAVQYSWSNKNPIFVG